MTLDNKTTEIIFKKGQKSKFQYYFMTAKSVKNKKALAAC